ncbi:G5 domain-containing protein [Aerococcus sp. UMB9870]|uniref:G5 domain-containing protein n=1 Tax=Aerococcus sp. UMB9870 TaxID=3046351 RepID=UPI00254F21CC|nr:G5 domain-containing protein [Aerococcus sp. UMB9870]MDK6368359.1 G5 domain-containing protein [Aerococcus sp. UMB9870]
MKKSFLPLATTSLILTAFLAQGEQVQAEEQPAAEYAATDKLAESRPAPELADPVEATSTSPEAAASENSASNATDDSHQSYRQEQDQKVIEEYEKLVEAPVEVEIRDRNESVVRPAQDEDEEVIYKQTYTGKAVIPKGEHIPTLDLNINLDAPIILQSFVNLDQEKAKTDGLAAIKELRSIVWDIEANSELIGEQVNPETGEGVEGVWINGERLSDRLKAEGITSKEEYVNRVSWNNDLENLALLNLGEAKGAYLSLRDYDELSKKTNANETYSDKVVLKDINSSLNLKENIIKHFGLDAINQHSYNQGIEKSNVSKFLNIDLNPRNKSFALAVDYQPWESAMPRSFSLISSDRYQEKTPSKNYKGEFIILYNQNFKERSQYQIIDFSPIFEGTQYELPIIVNSYSTTHRLVNSFEGNSYSLDSEIIKFNEDGSITALKPGKTILFININGILKSITVEVLPSPIVEDKITVWDRGYAYTKYIENPDMYEGQERVVEEGRPSLTYYLIRDTLLADGKFLNREFLKDWEIPGIDQIIEYGTKKIPEKTASDKLAPPGDIIMGQPYEVIPGYFEALPGYHIRLVPESEDQVLRINEQNLKTVIEPRDDLALGEHVIIQDGVNAYTEITNRIYKDHQNNILKTQEISRQDFPGQDLIIGVGTGKGISGLPAEEEPALPVHSKEPDSPRPPSTEQPVDTNPSGDLEGKGTSRGPVERPQAMPQGQSEGERAPSTHTEEPMTSDDSLRTSDDSVSNSYDQVNEEAGMDYISLISESVAPVSVAPEHLVSANPDKSTKAPTLLPTSKLGVRSEALASQKTDRVKVSSVKSQLHHRPVQTKLSNQSGLRTSAKATANAPRVFTQLPQTGGGSDQAMLGIGLSSLAVGLLLRLTSLKKRRNS